MKKLIDGIVAFRKQVRPSYRKKFEQLALGQSPDCLFFACSDSRVVPNLFASTDPGDLFVVRNVGGLVPACGADGRSVADVSEAAAIEYALTVLGVRDIVVCGHSECGAMRALLERTARTPNLVDWLSVDSDALEEYGGDRLADVPLKPHDRLSQLSTLRQIEHLKSYPMVRERLAAGTLGLHAWWFDLHMAEVLAYDDAVGRYVPIGVTPGDS